MRDAGVVDEHGELFACAHVGDRLDTGIGAEVRDQWANFDVRERGHELVEPIAATSHDHEVVPVGAEPLRKGPPDAGGRAGDECQPGARLSPTRFGVTAG